MMNLFQPIIADFGMAMTIGWRQKTAMTVGSPLFMGKDVH